MHMYRYNVASYSSTESFESEMCMLCLGLCVLVTCSVCVCVCVWMSKGVGSGGGGCTVRRLKTPVHRDTLAGKIILFQ